MDMFDVAFVIAMCELILCSCVVLCCVVLANVTGDRVNISIVSPNSTTTISTEPNGTVIVDGKQRLEAARAFMRNELPVFGYKIEQYEDKFRFSEADFSVNIAKLDKREDVLKWYVQFNSGGTPHSEEELKCG